MLARWAFNRGYRVTILSRGYGGRSSKKILEVSDGNSVKVRSEEAGDEPYLLAKMLSGVSIVISKKRYLGGLFAHKSYGAEFFILDDGFQHLQLKRDINVVLIDAILSFGNGHLLPWGPLREPVDSLARADAFILTRFKGNGSADKSRDFLRMKFPACPIFCADHLPDKLVFPYSEEVYEPGLLHGRSVVAFAGIAQPGLFKEALKGLGAEIIFFKAFRDHYWFKRDEIESLIHLKEKCGAEYLLTTEKDWARISSFESMCSDIGYLSIKFQLLSGEDDFFRMIEDAIKKKGIPVDSIL
jgi:tetraacyldisaccharide 4'-kinase